jgi:(R,R)-butanediol dehydrogenase / meso-butanediol dehydrogenase / diacetyl reductase
MRRALYTGDRTVTVEDSTCVPPGAGQVRIEVAYTGICGTDLHILHGAMDNRVSTPAVIGHEMSGRVAELGPGVEGWAVGDPVTVMPLDWCGDCPACRAGHSHICHNLNFVGIDSAGSMQASWTVPARLLVRLPDGLPLAYAALVEPTAVAVHDVRRGQVRAGEKVVVVGGGPVGLLVASVAGSAGADVLVLELDERRREVASRIGLNTMDPTTQDVAKHVEEWTAGAGADVAFEVSGSASGVATATDVLAVRGRLVMVAIHSVPREVNLFRLFWRELTVLGARVYEREDFERAAELVATGEVPAAELISWIVPLDDVALAFAALEGGGEVKVLIDCQADGACWNRPQPAFSAGGDG